MAEGSSKPRVGVAGWSLPSVVASSFATEGTHLQRYATRFSAVEINSSFYRPHRNETYARWAASVPPDFRFAVKLPRAITHERRLAGCRDLLESFAGALEGLGSKRGPVLVQLPPSLAFEPHLAEPFFLELRETVGGLLVCEPRHPSWFLSDVDRLLERWMIGCVAADPAGSGTAVAPGGWHAIAYFRLHGSPRIYRSTYEDAALRSWSDAVASACKDGAVWVIFDNTAAGAAVGDALRFMALLETLPIC